MATLTKAQKVQEQKVSLEYLEEWKEQILDPSSLLDFRIEYGKGMTDYVSVYLYYQRDGKGEIANMTYRVGKACGYTFRRSETVNQLALAGYGYSKTYDVALAMFRALDIESGQVNWQYR